MSAPTMTEPCPPTTAGEDYETGAVLYDTRHGGLRCASPAPDEVVVDFGYTGLPAGRPFVLDDSTLIGQITLRRFPRVGGGAEWRVRPEDARCVLGLRGPELDAVTRHLVLYLAAIAEDFLSRDDTEQLRVAYLTNRACDELMAIDAELAKARCPHGPAPTRLIALCARREELLALIEALLCGESTP